MFLPFTQLTNFPSHNSPASHAVHKAIPCLGHWVPTALRRCSDAGDTQVERHRDFFAINFTYWDWMWKINSKLNGMFFRNSQTRAESAGFVGFSLYIYIYIYIYIYSDSTLFIWKSWGNLARHDWKAEGIDCSHVRPWEIGWIMPVSCISTNLSWKHF